MFSAKTLDFTIRVYATCLVLQILQAFQVTWVVHGEYLEATVPELFRQFYRSGQAFGACRWLRSLQRQCEYIWLLWVPAMFQAAAAAAARVTST